MDPLAHTLVGACLAETGLKKKTPLATVVLLVGANVPDVDAFVSFAGPDTMYAVRRGWTHGVLAVVVWPWVLLALAMLGDRLRRRRDPTCDPAKPWPLLGIAALGVATHPLLDWLNNYGVRLLMPFSGRWFYGDSIFIIDPWMWLLAGAAVVLARSKTKMSAVAWLVLGLAATALVTSADLTPLAAKVVWCLAVAVILASRLRFGAGDFPRVARVCLGVLGAYIACMLAATSVARTQARTWLESRSVAVRSIVAGPVAANPFVRDVVAVSDERYHFVRVDWLGSTRFAFSSDPIPIGDGPIARAARRTPELQGTFNWMRLPSYTVERTVSGYLVKINDVRYSRIRDASIGRAFVELDHNLEPIRAGAVGP